MIMDHVINLKKNHCEKNKNSLKNIEKHSQSPKLSIINNVWNLVKNQQHNTEIFTGQKKICAKKL